MAEITVKESVVSIFGENVFNESVMRERLPKNIYKSLKKTIDEGLPLQENVADVVASAMKDWALEKGATHFTHWFQPMTGITAEKHDSFISPASDGKIIMEFSGKELVKGEPDASSFPSGGLRATFEARGYTAWDPTSYAFVKDGTLYIPTAFCSYSGEVLDKKTPLLRSMEAINCQALKILRLFGNTTATRVTSTVGPEQEYFLVAKELFEQRKDLIFTGRTLFGAKPPKGQEMEDHYFGSLKERVSGYMKELDEELWKLGILAKTKHNEVAPAQHELAPIFGTTNLATDHNQLVMEMMKKVAKRHGLECLLHEKPFAGVNGSGKHNNWSISTNDGQNLLDPGESPIENAQFLVFLTAVIKAIDTYSDLLRVTVATAGNDHRLGANEAPPAIVSVYLGDLLAAVLESIETGNKLESVKGGFMEIGVTSLPKLPVDSSDRNRTSPFAFTGNKFEFRMCGSSASIADTNTVLNTIVADVLSEFAEKLSSAKDFNKAVKELVRDTYIKHKRIIFNGNNYSDEWVAEAEKRGLSNFKSTVEALPAFNTKKSVDLFVKHKIFTEAEVHSRYEILLEEYSKTINIEALTMIDMANKQILPAALEFTAKVCDGIVAKKAAAVSANADKKLADKLASLTDSFAEKTAALESAVIRAKSIDDSLEAAKFYREVVFTAMQELRAVGDELETIVSEKYWPFPTYDKLLFNV
ncbi:MAG TPA: glutamine synthetase type III [Ruminococcaceae bacterium]|nr:glutamine synthetase type III [Oscillospiraceae bacterium]